MEICTGAGGQALGLERAGFDHEACVEIDASACETVRSNRPWWNMQQADMLEWSGAAYKGVDLLAGGVPCPPFSKAGKQLGSEDERNLFPRAIELVDEIRPRAVMFENVRGLMDAVFDTYRNDVDHQLRSMGYRPGWRLLNASDYGVPQLRPRVVFVALHKSVAADFEWPKPLSTPPPTVGETLRDLMASGGWERANEWAEAADEIAPTIVGGSKKHGGPDLGPTRARRAWAGLGVDGIGIADEPPRPGFDGTPRLTVRMAARLQGFPDDWHISGRKTAAYRQVGNAFPPPVATAVGESIAAALSVRTLHAVS